MYFSVNILFSWPTLKTRFPHFSEKRFFHTFCHLSISESRWKVLHKSIALWVQFQLTRTFVFGMEECVFDTSYTINLVEAKTIPTQHGTFVLWAVTTLSLKILLKSDCHVWKQSLKLRGCPPLWPVPWARQGLPEDPSAQQSAKK